MTDQISSLKVTNLSKNYTSGTTSVKAMNKLSLEASAGEILALHGASGSGKSTLLYAMAGLLTPDEGSVVLNGENITCMSQAERAGFRASHIGLVFQDFRLVPYLDVLGNVMVASDGGAEAVKRAGDVLARLGLSERSHHRPSQLSGGEQQRCAMARALVNDPSLILADEPTGNLDAENSGIILDFLKEFAQSGRIVIIATHDPIAVAAAQRRVALVNGEIKGETKS